MTKMTQSCGRRPCGTYLPAINSFLLVCGSVLLELLGSSSGIKSLQAQS